jgi:hypothetical protein
MPNNTPAQRLDRMNYLLAVRSGKISSTSLRPLCHSEILHTLLHHLLLLHLCHAHQLLVLLRAVECLMGLYLSLLSLTLLALGWCVVQLLLLHNV